MQIMQWEVGGDSSVVGIVGVVDKWAASVFVMGFSLGGSGMGATFLIFFFRGTGG